jgi:exodeoxyribonuclease-3
MRLITYNVNGIRSALKKDFLKWLQRVNADVVCLQEIRAEAKDIDKSIFEALGYHVYWYSAEKKGYSGTAILTKEKPLNIHQGFHTESSYVDNEGRLLRLDFDTFSILNVYMPSGTSGDERQNFKYEWLDHFFEHITRLKQQIPHLIICGDYNIAHQAIDIHNPISNKNSSGFLPEERAWLSKLLESGFIDTFRYFHQEELHHYTWWSSRSNARERNVGWRIDYFLASLSLQTRLNDCIIMPDAVHSDHCPVCLDII